MADTTRARSCMPAAIALLLLVAEASAAGTPAADVASAAPVTIRLRATDFGLPPILSFRGSSAEETVSIPIPPGTRPLELEAQVRTLPGAVSAFLAVEDRETPLATIALKPGTDSMDADLDGATLHEGMLVLKLRTAVDGPGHRPAGPLADWVECRDVSVTCRGRLEVPSAVADFWPLGLAKLRIFVPEHPGPEVVAAALELACIAGRLGGGASLATTLEPLDDGAPIPDSPADPLARCVVVRSGAHTATRLEVPHAGTWPTLVLTVASGEPSHDLDGIAGGWRPLLIASRLPARPGTARPARDVRTVSFADLGYAHMQVRGEGSGETHLRFCQADLGGPVAGLAVHVAGTFAPAASGVRARLQVLLNGGLVASAPLDATGALDLEAAVPMALVTRENDLALRVVTEGPDAGAASAPSVLVRIDDASSLGVLGGASELEGFERFPQALLPRFDVAFDALERSGVEPVARLLAMLQRLTRTPLRPHLVTLDAALAGVDPLVVAVSDPARAAPLRPPLDAFGLRLGDQDDPSLPLLDGRIPFASLQALLQRDRDVLLLSRSGDPDGPAALLASLPADQGWYGLAGDVCVRWGERSPVSFRARRARMRVRPLPVSFWRAWASARPVTCAIALVLLTAFLGWAYPRLVRGLPGAPA